MGTQRTPSGELFDAILGDLPTLISLQLRYGISPSTVIRRRLAAGADPAAIAEEFRCPAEQVERWIALVQPAGTPAAGRAPSVPSPVVQPVLSRKPGKLMVRLQDLLGDRARALGQLQQAGSLANLHRHLNLDVHFSTFYSAVRRLYGKDFATSVVRERPAKVESSSKGRGRPSVATQLPAILGSRDEAITRLNAAGSASALLDELKLNVSYFTFRTALQKLYGADILSTIVRPKRTTVSKPSDGAPVLTSGLGRGTEVQIIVSAFGQVRNWPGTARRLNTTLEKLREIVQKNPADFAGSISSDNLRVLLKIERPVLTTLPKPETTVPLLLPGQVQHPCGLTLSKETASGLETYLATLNVTEAEFFTGYYDPDSALEVAEAVGTSVEVLDQIAAHHKTQTQTQPA